MAEKKLALIGLNEQKIKETSKNEALTSMLVTIIDQVQKENSGTVDKEQGKLIYALATKLPKQALPHLPLLSSLVAKKSLDQEAKLLAAIAFVQSSAGGSVDLEKLKKQCGVGVVVTHDAVEELVKRLVAKHKEEMTEQRYRFNLGPLLGQAKAELLWADTKKLKEEFDLQVLTLLGPKTEGDLAKPKKKVTKTAENTKKVKETNNVNGAGPETTQVSMADLLRNAPFHAPGENFKTDGYVITPETEKLLKQHLGVTGGKVRTRFPPEPNGILHIGHAKAININFGYAQAHGGTCNLRYDDTNPEKEEEKFFVGIKDMVEWLGYTPSAITHSSDNFAQLHSWACQLIEGDMAYVCHQKPEEVRGRDPPPSPWRERPKEESQKLFRDMKDGLFEEGEATLRLKLTLEEGKVDPVAYRIKYVAHHRTGTDWCIYPTYDYTHCLCDSIEHISHSLCTKEFQNRRSSYYWLCNALGIYCPVQWEYGRLNMAYAVVSKRKIAKLIDNNIVADWDDPRLFTLTALRRRGFPSSAINRFCASLGLTGAQVTIHPDNLESVVRDTLNTTAHRRMVVLSPLKVTLTALPPGLSPLEVPNIPGDPSAGTYSVTLGSTVYIDRDDFRKEGDKGYRRLTLTQGVGLRHAGLVIRVTSEQEDGSLSATCEAVTPENKPQAFIHWVSDPVKCEVRLYDKLFLHECPEDEAIVPGGFLSDINPHSLTVMDGAYMDRSLVGAPPLSTFQFERCGFFAVDKEATEKRMVFNRTVGLREDRAKN